MDDFLAATSAGDDGEVVVQRSQLQGLTPFPTWNGTIAAASTAGGGAVADGRCSLLCENGDVAVLQALSGELSRSQDYAMTFKQVKNLQVERILRSPVNNTFGSFCQCWSSDGSVFATAHDRHISFYNTKHNFCLQLSVQLRFSVASMDIAKWSGDNGDEDRGVARYMLMVGTVFGAYIYKVELSISTSNQEDGETSNATINDTLEPLPALASAYEETPICFVKFSQDALTVALGTVDGRLYVHALTANDIESHSISAFGSQVFSKVLAAPRVTSISFSPCNRKLAVATRKGNMYVLTRSSGTGDGKWQMHSPCKELSANPKLASSGSSSAGAVVAMQTFVCWWGGDSETSSSVLVVASRSMNYRLEMVDADSGKLVHSLQMAARPPNDGDLAPMTTTTTTDDHLLTGMCCVNLPNGLQKLVCHDSDSNVSLITWPLLEIAGYSSLRV